MPERSRRPSILAGLIGGILWNLLTWLLGIPSSSSHALIGGVVGAVVVAAGFDAVEIGGLVGQVLAAGRRRAAHRRSRSLRPSPC